MYRMQCVDGQETPKNIVACKRHHPIILEKWMKLRHKDVNVVDEKDGQCVLCPERVAA